MLLFTSLKIWVDVIVMPRKKNTYNRGLQDINSVENRYCLLVSGHVISRATHWLICCNSSITDHSDGVYLKTARRLQDAARRRWTPSATVQHAAVRCSPLQDAARRCQTPQKRRKTPATTLQNAAGRLRALWIVNY